MTCWKKQNTQQYGAVWTTDNQPLIYSKYYNEELRKYE